MRCDDFIDFNGTAKVLVVGNCSSLQNIDEMLGFGPFHSVTNVTFDCVVTHFPWEFANIFPNIRHIHINKCNLTSLPWQSIWTETLKTVDFSSCPIQCSCQNQWMRAKEIFEKITEPKSLRKCAWNCDPGKMMFPGVIYSKNGDNVTVHVGFDDQVLNRTIDKPYFDWAFSKHPHKHEEIIAEKGADLMITNLKREDMGVIGVKCWHCLDFLVGKIELRANYPVKVAFVDKTRLDTDFLVVTGYPIDNISMAITKMQSNYSETNFVGREKDAIFFSSLVVRMEKRPLFYQKTYRVFTKDAAEGDHLSGDLRFEVCTNGSCDAIEKHVSHLGLINGTIDDFIIVEYPYKQEIQIVVFLIVICLLIVVSALAFYHRLKLQSFLREKILSFRKRISLAQELQTRRASQETEETLLRLEERSSLASDYTNMTLPFIDMGNIEIHEMLGKGHFGEVYLASWDYTGPRSVAVKSIRRVDMATEKEARVLQDLEHPNIVKLYGMTRNNFNLLLVFEHMNHGDLKTYLEQRAPVKSVYLQYPPPLVIDELKWIIKEITTGLVYLVEQSIVHRDLAARNCLVAGDSDLKATSHFERPPIRVKISDFGMSRRLYDHSEYYTMDHRGALPVRWLPPEAVQSHKFTYNSDIWSLGVTMWECMSYGRQPFDGLSNLEVSSFTLAGMRPLKPERCPQDMYDLMVKCWHMEPVKRITAKQILEDELFDKIREGLPYRAANEANSLVSSCMLNINRYKDVVAETSFTTDPLNSSEIEVNDVPTENGKVNGQTVEKAEYEKSESESDSGAVTFHGECSEDPLLCDQSDELPIFASA